MNAGKTQGWDGRTQRRGRVVRGVAGISALAVLVCVIVFLTHRDPPQKAAAEIPSDTPSRSHAAEQPAVIRSRGVVAPKTRVEIMSEVGGRVIYTHSQFRAGGLIRANEKIAQIDPGSYELAVRRARAAVDEAQARLDLELAAQGVRRPQGQPFDVENRVTLPTILHDPLVRQAEAALESAKAELAMAELQLARTSIILPFDVLIAGQTASLGQYADVGRSLAVAYGTEAFEIEAPLGDEDRRRLGDVESAQGGAEVRAVLAGREHAWPARVLHATNQVDPESGTTSIIVEVPRPLAASGDRPALLPGMTVEVVLGGAGAAEVSNDAENAGER